jgi:SAM-dependent methyltransferase
MIPSLARQLAPFGDRVDFRVADASALPLGDGKFDAVLSFLLLHHVGVWEKALVEAARVLRSGGLLLGYDILANPLRAASMALDAATGSALSSGMLWSRPCGACRLNRSHLPKAGTCWFAFAPASGSRGSRKLGCK